MTTRELPASEWHKLRGTEAEAVIGRLAPADGRVLVIEDEGRIIGTWVFFKVVHAECVWIAPEHRGQGTVARRLLTGMLRIMRSFGAKAFFTASVTEDVDALIGRLGGSRVPGTHWMVPVQE